MGSTRDWSDCYYYSLLSNSLPVFWVPTFAANLTNSGMPGWVFFMFMQLTSWQLIHLKKAYASVNWPTTTGIITESEAIGIYENTAMTENNNKRALKIALYYQL